MDDIVNIKNFCYPFSPREREFFGKSGFKIFNALSRAARHRIRIRRLSGHRLNC